jgi:hypothetical protein
MAPANHDFMSDGPGRVPSEFTRLIATRVPLVAQGNDLRGSCPLHPDPSRSFYVHPHRPCFHCFGCGTSGGLQEWSDLVARL